MHKAEHVLSRSSQTASPLRAVRTVSHATSAPPVAMGNQAMQRLLIQAKLPVNQPGDSFEPKVDREAELAGHGGDPMLLSAATPNRSAVGSLQRLYVNQSGLQMRHSSGGRPVPSGSLRPSQSGILQRKCACGGSAGMSGKCEECSKKQRLGLQTKLQVNEPGDIYEQEADRIADHVMAATAHPIVNGAPPRIQRLAAQPAGQMDAAPASVDQALASPGRPLEPALRQDMEQRFGHDFSRVRVHSGAAAEQSAQQVNASAYTAGHDIVFGAGRFAPGTHEGRRLIAHELTHVVQQDGGQLHQARAQAKEGAGGPSVVQRQPKGAAPARTASQQPLRFDTIGTDTNPRDSVAVIADRMAKKHGGTVLRVDSMKNMIDQIDNLLAGNKCLGELVIWYHGSPEIQLLVGNYELPIGKVKELKGEEKKRKEEEDKKRRKKGLAPVPDREMARIQGSGFTRQWLQAAGNRPLLNRFRHMFCCGGTMQWIGCGTATIRAPGGLRTEQELKQGEGNFERYPDIYQSAKDAERHGANLSGGSFGAVNVQAWANATCATVRSATNFVTLDLKAPDEKGWFTIDGGGQWVDAKPQGVCPCDPATGRIGGEAPSREDMVKAAQKQTAAFLGGKENVLWHQKLLALRSGLPHATEVVGAGTSQGDRTFEAKPGSLPQRLQDEMKNRAKVGHDPKSCGNAGPLECYYLTLIRELLHLAGEGVTPPDPLAKDPIPPLIRFVRVSAGGTWAAVTQRHLAVVNRDDFWSWMVFSDRAISETPAFTRTVIQHELEHAADYERDLVEFEKTNPRPTTTPPPRYSQPAEKSVITGWNDQWGKYINAFIAFSEGRTRPERHLEIVIGQALQQAKGGGLSVKQWSSGERAFWFQLAFQDLPPDVPAGTKVPGEEKVQQAFDSAGSSLQLAAVQRAYWSIKRAICETEGKDADEIEKNRGPARTLVQHFDPIVKRAFAEHWPQMTAGEALNLLRSKPGADLRLACPPNVEIGKIQP